MSTQKTPEFVYGYGRTKHIYGQTITTKGWRGYPQSNDFGLCGAAGGYPHEEPGRPVCKRCERAAKKQPAPTAGSPA